MPIDIELTKPQVDMMLMRNYRIPFPLFIGGYGCGKSFILAHNAIRDMFSFYGCKVGVYAPTHDLLSLNLVPIIEQLLTQMGLTYKHNKQQHIIYCMGSQIIMRSMNDPGRIVAYEVYASHVDEADLMTTVQKGDDAWNRIIARNRQKHPDKKQHFNMVSAYSTPEGFKFTHQRWKKKPGIGYKYVQAPTSTNWNLDITFIQNLKNTYTPEQCVAYLEGIWTNIFTGSVYSYYDRDHHNTDRILLPNEQIYAGCDFNYGGSCVAIYVPKTMAEVKHITKDELKDIGSKPMSIREKKAYLNLFKEVGLNMVDEFVANDTEEMVEILNGDYAGHPITMFPDATGNSNSTNASASDIAMLKQGGMAIKANSVNPRIVNRINSVQRLLHNDLLSINKRTCPRTAESIEEHAYNDVTGLPEKIAKPGSIDDRNDAMGYCPAFLFPIKKTITHVRSI